MNNMNFRENRVHSSEVRPFSYYKCCVPDGFGCVPMHWHSEFELSYIREGEAEFICGEEKFTSAKGDIIITQPNVLHSIYPCRNARQIYDTLVFSGDIFGAAEQDRYFDRCVRPLISGSMKLPARITPNHHYYAELSTAAENIFSCAKGDSPLLDMLMRSELLRLFWLLETEAETAVPGTDSVIRPALEYIAAHYSENITIERLAATVHLSKSYFMNRFREYVGLSAVEYISHYRIDKSCKALIGTKKSVMEIALLCGYGNLSNFNRQFRKIAGCSPTEYKKKHSRVSH